MPITLKTFTNPIDAHFLKSKLENEGIWCELLNENFNSIYPLSNVSISGIDLVIHAEDQERAISILEQNAHHIADYKTMKQVCPHCNSARIQNKIDHVKGHGFLTQIKSLFVDFFNLGQSFKHICRDCKRKF